MCFLTLQRQLYACHRLTVTTTSGIYAASDLVAARWHTDRCTCLPVSAIRLLVACLSIFANEKQSTAVHRNLPKNNLQNKYPKSKNSGSSRERENMKCDVVVAAAATSAAFATMSPSSDYRTQSLLLVYLSLLMVTGE